MKGNKESFEPQMNEVAENMSCIFQDSYNEKFVKKRNNNINKSKKNLNINIGERKDLRINENIKEFTIASLNIRGKLMTQLDLLVRLVEREKIDILCIQKIGKLLSEQEVTALQSKAKKNYIIDFLFY